MRTNKFTYTIITCLLSLSLTAQSNLDSLRKKAEKYRAESKYDSALMLFEEIGLEAQSSNDIKYQMISAMGLGGLNIDLKNWSEAISSYRKSMGFAQIIGDKSYENRGFFGIGVGYHLKWNYEGEEINYDSAVYYYSVAKDMFIGEGEKQQASDLLYNISLLNSRKGEFDEAFKNLSEANIIHKEIDDLRGVGRDLKQFGILYNKQGKVDSAEIYYKEALTLTDSAGFLDDELVVMNLLAELYESRRDFEEAIKYRKSSYSKSRRIFTEDYNDKLLELREQYNTASLELDNQKQENELLRQQRSKNAILIIGVALIIIFSVWLYIVDQRRKNIKILSAKNDEINKQKIDDLLQDQEIASLQGVLEGQETERKRVAIDLHDRLGGILSMVKLHFSAVEEKIDIENPNKKKFLTASELLDLAAGEVRNISHNLMSGVLAKFGLIPALEDLRTRISDTGKLKVNLYTNNVKGSLEGEQELQLYRIVQELMSNILKHSEAKEANIQLNESEGNVNLIVEDDGVGFNPEKLGKKSGIGLSNLKARVAKLDGTFHIDSGKGAGTTISIDIPVTND